MMTSPFIGRLTLRCATLQINDLIDLDREELREVYMESFGRVMGI